MKRDGWKFTGVAIITFFCLPELQEKILLHVKFLQSNSLSSLSCWEGERDQVTRFSRNINATTKLDIWHYL